MKDLGNLISNGDFHSREATEKNERACTGHRKTQESKNPFSRKCVTRNSGSWPARRTHFKFHDGREHIKTILGEDFIIEPFLSSVIKKTTFPPAKKNSEIPSPTKGKLKESAEFYKAPKRSEGERKTLVLSFDLLRLEGLYFNQGGGMLGFLLMGLNQFGSVWGGEMLCLKNRKGILSAK